MSLSPYPDLLFADLENRHPTMSCSTADAQKPSIQDIVPWEELKLRETYRALKACDGNVPAAARALGVSRATFYRYIQKNKIRYDDARA